MDRENEPHDCPICDEEIAHLQEAVANSNGIERAEALMELGMAALFGGRDELALASFGACRDLVSGGDYLELESAALFRESCTLAVLGRFDEAIDQVTKAKAICEEEHDLDHLSLCEWREGTYYLDKGDVARARELITSARNRYLTINRLAMASMCELDLQNIEKKRRPIAKRQASRPSGRKADWNHGRGKRRR